MKGLRITATAVLMTLLVTAMAYAEGHGEGGHHYDWTNLAFRVVNFIIFIGIIWKVAGKKIVGFFSGRRQGIEQELNDLETRKADAEKQLAEVERRIASLETERKAILAECAAQGEQIKDAIIAKAEHSAKLVIEQAKRTADNEIKSAIVEMRSTLADEIIVAASAKLQSELTADKHAKLIDKYLTKVVLK
ncbi:MAG: ATP synthase F0 subunit B [Pseudomonadota bacterium]